MSHHESFALRSNVSPGKRKRQWERSTGVPPTQLLRRKSKICGKCPRRSLLRGAARRIGFKLLKRWGGRGSAEDVRALTQEGGTPPRFLANTDSKGDETRILCNARIPRHLQGRFFCVLAVHLLIPKSLRPELMRFGARLIDMDSRGDRDREGRKVEESKVETSQVERAGARRSWKSEVRKRECGQLGQAGLARPGGQARRGGLGATSICHVTSLVNRNQVGIARPCEKTRRVRTAR